ncbi:ParA family protein [Clostridium sp. 'deep sea']|uniref:ParA family protein n=1 Tax=Clostridium sp. 'deep sea' TaxID=2779445 RepID=UPI001896A2C8|nr:AAA family ATPase [Clostridium sp. 'deep sea']QOR34096.1 ParA family protein [Clostridium sp. 'deep sea']
MIRIYALANQKGGVGKTTTAVNLSACLAKQGKKVLLVDIDPQGNSTSGLGIRKHDLKYCIYNVLIDDYPLEMVIKKTEIDNLDIVPATLNLAGAEIELVPMFSRESKLDDALEYVKDTYDYILIDCPPSLGLLTFNAFTAATDVLIPIQCEFYALEGLSQLINSINLARQYLNKNLNIGGVVLTMYDSRTKLSQEVAEEVKKYFPDKIFNTIIHRNVRLSEAPSHGKPIISYDINSSGAMAYTELAREVIANE